MRAVILLAKFGFRANEVAMMTHAEVACWVDCYLQSQGMKSNAQSGDAVHYHFLNKKKKGA